MLGILMQTRASAGSRPHPMSTFIPTVPPTGPHDNTSPHLHDGFKLEAPKSAAV